MKKQEDTPKREQRIRVQFDISYKGAEGSKNNGESHVVPDMNLTVRQLLENHTRGKSSEVEVRKPLYFELPIPVINDLTDVAKYRKQLDDQMKSVDDFIKKENETAASAAKQKAKDDNKKAIITEYQQSKKKPQSDNLPPTPPNPTD